MTGWNAAGYSMEKGINTNKTTNLGITKPQNPDVIDTISEVRSELKNSKYAVITLEAKRSGMERIPDTVITILPEESREPSILTADTATAERIPLQKCG